MFGLPQNLKPLLQDASCVDDGYKTSAASEDGRSVPGEQSDVPFVIWDDAHRTY